METTQSIGQRIKLVRGELSQKAFGARIGLSQTAVTALETDQSEPRLGTFNSIVEAFNINPEWLRTGKGGKWSIKDPTTVLDTVSLPAAQLPPPVPSEAKPTQPGGGEGLRFKEPPAISRWIVCKRRCKRPKVKIQRF